MAEREKWFDDPDTKIRVEAPRSAAMVRAETAEVEVRALREALEEIEQFPAIMEPNPDMLESKSIEMGRYIGWRDAALIARRALAPELPEGA